MKHPHPTTQSEPQLAQLAIPDTTFPPLDTIYRPPIVRTLQNGQIEDCQSRKSSRRGWKNFQSQIPLGPLRLEHSAIYESYSRFISDFIGCEDVAFRAKGLDRSTWTTVCAQISSEERRSCIETPVSWSLADEGSGDTLIDFALDILQDPGNAESYEHIPYDTRFIVTFQAAVDGSFSRILLRVEHGLVSDTDAAQLFNALIQYLWPSSVEDFDSSQHCTETCPEMSILNFPPLNRPPPLAQDDGKPQVALLHAAFERRVLEHPHRIALDFLEAQDYPPAPKIRRTFTYATLNQLTQSLAEKILGRISSRTSTVVPVLLSTSPELYISYLAVLKAGLAFCPLPVDAPPQRLQDMIEDLNPQVILGAETYRRRLLALDDLSVTSAGVGDLKWMDVEQFTKNPVAYIDTRRQLVTPPALTQPQEEDVCYVMYTSGSTGRPKGVAITHLAASSSIAAHAVTSPLPPSSEGIPRWFQFAAPTFDPSLMEIFVTLSTGATLCSATRDLTLTDIEGTVSELGATVMMSTPSMAATIRRSKLLSIRSLWTMGETLLRKNIDDFACSGTNTDGLCNAYGPTETAINCTLLSNFQPGDRGSIIGPPLSTCSLFVIDPSTMVPTPVPRGFAGELAIGGPQVSTGYLNRPDQNLKSFVDSPEFGRLYRTGDKARIVTDSNGQNVVEFLGRIDTSQVKLSGRRVDLGEIDTVVSVCKGVKEAVTVSYKRFADQHGSEEAVTFLVLDESVNTASIEAACRETAASRLLSYMCPTKYLVVTRIPRSLTGKVDRKVLSSMVEQFWPQETPVSDKALGNGGEMNGGSAEDLFCRILGDVLGKQSSDIKPTTNFFSIGMDSLRAIRFLQQARDAGIVGLSISDVLQGASARRLATFLTEPGKLYLESVVNGNCDTRKEHDRSIDWDMFLQKYEKTCAKNLGINPEHIEKILPTTATQSGMLASFVRSSFPTEHSKKRYIHHSVHHINPSIDISRLQTAWMVVLDRHDAYKMVFLPVDDDKAPFVQCVLSGECPLVRESRNRYHCEVDAQDNFDEAIQSVLEVAENDITIERPSIRLTAVTNPNRSAIVCSIFHGVFDGASLQLLFNEVVAEYSGVEAPRRTEISAAVDMHFNSDAKTTLEFWLAQLKDCDPTPFPSLTGLRPEMVTKIPHHTTRLATTTLNSLRGAGQRSLASPLTILQAAWALLLVTYKDNLSSSTFGSVISGRLDKESEICMGPTFTTIPVTIPSHILNEDSSSTTVLQQLTELNTKTFQHLQIPLNSITTSTGGLYYDTLLAFQDFASGSGDTDLWHTVDYPAMGNDFAVMIEVWPEADGTLRLRATYTDEYLDEASASLMLQQFNDVIAFITESPERRYLDGRFATTPSQSPLARPSPIGTEIDKILQEPFERNAKSNPNDIALVFKGELQSGDSALNIEWTYAELNQRANRLARYLVARFGRLNDKVVPFSLEKSPELYVAVLGILKAGAAWCPVDPSFPVDRRHDLLARTDATMLLVANKTAFQEAGAVPAGVTIVDINDLIVKPEDIGELDDLTAPRPHDMAYLIWTSGTTGLPKGVQVQHNSAAESMKSLQNLIEVSDEGTVRCLQFSQPTFDVFVQDLFYTWAMRGTVISATKEIMLGSFAQLSNQTKATHAHLTPAFATIIPRQHIKTLQTVTMIGESLPQQVADNWGHNMKAYNTYGPAEVSVVSTVRKFGGCANNFKSTNVGFTLPSVAAFVINNGRVIMKGGVGELALAGSQVARGYWKDPSKTNEKFLWNDSAKAHIYMTGDIVRQLHDGSFEFVGRRDDLVKLSGMRVELSEISFALAKGHSDIEQVATMHIGRSDRPAKVIVVFLSVPQLQYEKTKGDTPITNEKAAEIANAASMRARRTLPEHMIPSVFIVLSSIPVTTSAKIDRNALVKAYELIDLEAWEKKMSPAQISEWSSDDFELVELISSFSGTTSNSISPTSRLSALGIDSISAIRLTVRLKSAGYSVSTANLLGSRTVGNLCAILTASASNIPSPNGPTQVLDNFNNQWHTHVKDYLKDTNNAAFKVCPSLRLQENLLSETFRNYKSYWSNHFFNLGTNIDLDALHDAWRMVTSKNEALRVGFVPKAAIDIGRSNMSVSTFIQVIYDEPIVDWTCVKVNTKDFWNKAKQKSQDIAFKHQEASFLQPCWAVTIFDRGDSKTMMFTVHHSIHDGSSLDFITDDLHDAYMGSSATFRKRHQLGEAVAILSVYKSTPEEDVHFWEATLKGFTVDDDASSKPNAKIGKHHEVTVSLSVSFAELQRSAQSFECSSVTSILRAAWGCTVADLLEANEKSIVLGEVASERLMDSSLYDVIGPLVSLIPAPVFGQGTAREIVAKHDQVMANAWKHRNISPGAVRKLAKRPQNQALYPAVFVFHPQAGESHTTHNLWTQTEDLLGLNVEHGLTLNVEQQTDGTLKLVVSAEASVLSAEGVELLARQLNALISTMYRFPDEPISQLTNQFPRELISVTKCRNFKVSDIVSHDNPLCWFEYWAKAHPDWPAAEIVESLGQGSPRTVSWSYSKLDDEANRVAVFIASSGVSGRMIGMCLGRTLSAFAITLGIFKSRNTYLPIDEDLPNERKAFLLRDSNAAIFFTTGSAEFAPECCKVIDVEHDRYRLEQTITKDIPRSKNDAAYLLYTSGTTGTPKGVLISNSNLTSFSEAQSEFICANVPATLELGGIGKYLGLASRAFDVHVGEMFLAWRWGLCCVTGKRSMLLDDLPLALKELRVTHASFVPSLLDQVGLVPANVPLLKYMGVGGEKISQRTLESFGNSDTVALINAYGPTEVTIGCCSARVSSKSNLRNIGRVLGDTVAHVLVPGMLTYAKRGMEGELCLTGSLVGIGYHNRNTGAFVQSFNGEKMYRTGDLVRLMPDDSIEIFGRSDDQTKIRGQRLELGEVSECVRTLSPRGADVASLITKHPNLSRMQLVSFVARSISARGGQQPMLLENFEEINTTIRAGCKERLPAYMVPDVVLPISFLPLAATSGKADVKLLKNLFATLPLQKLLSTEGRASSSNREVDSREFNEDERVVAKLLRALVKANDLEIKPSTNIFEAGVDSLVAISLSTLMRKHGYDCQVADILSAVTVEDLGLLPRSNTSINTAMANKASVHEKLAAVQSAFRRSEVGQKFGDKAAVVRPCLPVQEAVVARSLDKDSGDLYVNHIILELSPDVDTSKLREAWKSAARDHEILRTCFCQVENDILQVVLAKDSFALSWNEDIAKSEDGLLKLRRMQLDIARNIVTKIQEVPPMRLNLMQPASPNGKYLFSVSIHHALYDAESLSLLMTDIYLRYKSLELPTRPSAGALVKYIASVDDHAAFIFWTKALQNYQSFPPTSSGSLSADQAKTCTRLLKNSLSSLESCASHLRVTLPTLAQTIFGIAMAKASSVNDFIFGLVLSGRSVPVPGIEKLLAPSITTIPQRIDLRRPDSSVLDVLLSIQKASGQMIQFQHISLRAIHKWVKADQPLFNSLFSYIKTEIQPSYEDVWKEVESYMPPDYPFAVEFEARTASNDLVIRAGYTSDFGSEAQVENLLEMMELLINTIANGGGIRVKSLGIEARQGQGLLQSDPALESQEFIEQELKIKDILFALGDFGSESISRHSTFFRLGVDSVIAIRFAQKLRAAGFEVSSSDIARYASIAKLSEHISSKKQSATSEALQHNAQALTLGAYKDIIPLFAADDHISAIYACTPLQTGLLTQTVASDGRLYIHHPTVQLINEIEIEKLKTAWNSVVESLDILRTTFHYVENPEAPWIAAVHDKPLIKWFETDIEENIEQSINDLVEETTFTSPEMFSEPPVKVTFLMSSAAIFMTVSLHHSLYDGWSLPLIFDTLLTAYTEEAPQARTPFSDAANLIVDLQSSGVSFWYEKVSSYTATSIPSSLSPAQSTSASSKISIGMPASQILERCKSMDINLQSVALLAYGKVLCSLVKRRDIVFGYVVSGRSLPLPDVEQIIGPLFNTIPFRVRLDNPLLTNQDVVMQVQRTIVDSQKYQHASLNTIQRQWRQRQDSDIPLLDALFVFQKATTMDNAPKQELWKPFEMEDSRDTTEYGLNIEFEQGLDQITLSASSPVGRLDSQALNTFCISFDAILRDILESPLRSVTAFPEDINGLPISTQVNLVAKETSNFEDLADNPALGVLRAAFSEVSKIPAEKIDASTSIFSLGIDSIVAIQVASICRRQEVQISVADVLQGRSLGGIVRILMSKTAPLLAEEKMTSVSVDIKDAVLARLKYPTSWVENVLPSLAGQVYHLASWLKTGRTFYEPTWAFVSDTRLDHNRLAAAWSTLQERHSILRTVFATLEPREAYQAVLSAKSPNEISMSSCEDSENLIDKVKRLVNLSAQTSSTLFTPPISLQLVQGKTQDAVLIRLHHSLYDAWTMNSLVSELSALYLGQSKLSAPNFPEFVWHTQNAATPATEGAYWKYALSHAERTIIQSRPHDPHEPLYPYLKQTFVWVRRVVPNLSHKTQICKQSGVAFSTAIILAFSHILGQQTHTQNPTFGLFQAARSASFPDIAKVDGPCMNLLPFSTPVTKGGKTGDLEMLVKVQEELAKRVPFEQSHLRNVLAWKDGLDPSSPESKPQPLFNASLNLLWHGAQTTENTEDKKQLLKPLDIGVPTDFASEEPIPGETAVDDLETGYLAARNLFVDVGPVEETDSIDFGVKCDFILMDDEMVRGFVGQVASEIERIVGCLERIT